MTLQRPQRLFTQACTSLLADSLHLVVRAIPGATENTREVVEGCGGSV